jgi:hypothetical protein
MAPAAVITTVFPINGNGMLDMAEEIVEPRNIYQEGAWVFRMARWAQLLPLAQKQSDHPFTKSTRTRLISYVWFVLIFVLGVFRVRIFLSNLYNNLTKHLDIIVF